MVGGMTQMPHAVRSERPPVDSVVTAVVEIAGARHEVLPPRRIVCGGRFTPAAPRAAPP